jgi:two-component SAPR family response regulator
LPEVIDVDRIASTRPDSAPALAASVRHDGAVLPALASVGLAVGVASHIQRERAVLLRDVPASTRIKRPSAAALATGIALFDRARAAEPRPSGAPITGADDASRAAQLVVPLGVSHDRLVSVTMQPGEVVSIEAGEDDGLGILRHMLNTVALAPWLHQPVVVACGFGDDDVIVRRGVVIAKTPVEAKHHALRAKHEEPLATVMVVAREYSSELSELSAFGVLMVSRCIDDHDKTIHITREHNHWRLSTTDECFRPYAVSHAEASSLQSAVQEMTVLETTDLAVTTPWHTLVRVLGPVQVVSNDQSEVIFRKSKSVELLCWLAFHRDRPTVSGARTALWEIDVRDATFHNVLSELRHGLGTAGLANGVGRVNKQRLFVDDRIVTDGESLRATLQQAESLPTDDASAQLQEALACVRGLPFSSMNYAWADAEGITSTLVWLVTRSVECAADLATQRCDRTALLTAVSAGLRMSPADEQFTALLDRVPARIT